VISPFKFDEIGYWSEIKLEIVEKYGQAYTGAFRNQPHLKKYYIDGFSGAGIHVSKATGKPVDGSPTRALRVTPPFDGFYFIDMDADKTAYLQKLCEGRREVHFHTGDTNSYLTRELLPKIQYKYFNRALCLLDPYGLHLDWEVIAAAGESKAIDMFLNFPVMDMNRNAIWRHPELAPRDGVERMTRFWGDETWREMAYAENPQKDFFGRVDVVKQDNDAIVTAFRHRLKAGAGFSFVPAPVPMKNSRNAVVYYLFFASQKPVAEKILLDILKKYET
jgi:three-Cys-motif partner protein